MDGFPSLFRPAWLALRLPGPPRRLRVACLTLWSWLSLYLYFLPVLLIPYYFNQYIHSYEYEYCTSTRTVPPARTVPYEYCIGQLDLGPAERRDTAVQLGKTYEKCPTLVRLDKLDNSKEEQRIHTKYSLKQRLKQQQVHRSTKPADAAGTLTRTGVYPRLQTIPGEIFCFRLQRCVYEACWPA